MGSVRKKLYRRLHPGLVKKIITLFEIDPKTDFIPVVFITVN